MAELDIRLIRTLDDPDVAAFAALTEAQLRNRLDPGKGLFIAESPKVIRIALDKGYEPVSMLCERKHIWGDASDIAERIGCPIFTGDRTMLEQLTGYVLTRGVLCAMRRKPLPTIEDVCRDARRIAVIDGVCDSTNIGAIFRSAAALGIDGIVLTTDSCDPLNRRSVRVSMGSVFLIPWTVSLNSLAELKRLGFATAAMALKEESVGIDDPRLRGEKKLAIILGTEGDGLSNNVIAETDYTVMIPMHHGVDSLNVAAASAVAFWELCK